MDLKNLRDWLFEVIAILLPGSIAFAIVIIFIFDPTGFIIRIVDFQQIEGVLLPFESQAVNIIFFFSISFILGHFIQQITNPLLNFYIKILGIKRRYMTNIVFESKEIQKFLLPKEVEFNGSLNSFDYYLMVYTDVAPKTNRNTYISISDFCVCKTFC